MTTPRVPLRRSPLVLVVDDQEWSTRSLESVLMPSGFAMLRSFNGAKAVERARADAPDIAVVARTLPDTDGLALCSALREQLGGRVPLLVTMHERPTRDERLAALRAGAWDILVPPIDAEELILRLEAYMRAKLDAERIQETGLVDARTGLYNANGLERRAAELGAWAQRQGESLSCVFFGVVLPGTADETSRATAVDGMVNVLRREARTSDALGRTGQSEVVVLAPGTDAAQAVKLAERLAAALRADGVFNGEGGPKAQLRGGYESVSHMGETPLRGPELVARASVALARAKAERTGEWLLPFRPLPGSLRST